MSGGSWEMVAGYMNNGDENIARYGESLVNAEGKYKNVYYSITTSGSELKEEDYEYANPNYAGTYPEGYGKKYGDAVWETSSGDTAFDGWFGDASWLPFLSSPFFSRGGFYDYGRASGVFCFSSISGASEPKCGFRVSVPVL